MGKASRSKKPAPLKTLLKKHLKLPRKKQATLKKLPLLKKSRKMNHQHPKDVSEKRTMRQLQILLQKGPKQLSLNPVHPTVVLPPPQLRKGTFHACQMHRQAAALNVKLSLNACTL